MFCAFVMLLGAMVTAVMFGEMAVVMGNMNKSNTKFA